MHSFVMKSLTSVGATAPKTQNWNNTEHQRIKRIRYRRIERSMTSFSVDDHVCQLEISLHYTWIDWGNLITPAWMSIKWVKMCSTTVHVSHSASLGADAVQRRQCRQWCCRRSCVTPDSRKFSNAEWFSLGWREVWFATCACVRERSLVNLSSQNLHEFYGKYTSIR